MVDCKICTHPYCEHAGTQRGIVVSCNGYIEPKKPQTNADRIRAMSDEELEDGIRAVSLGYDPWCDHHCKMCGDDNCNTCLANWLQQPVKDGEGDGD